MDEPMTDAELAEIERDPGRSVVTNRLLSEVRRLRGEIAQERVHCDEFIRERDSLLRSQERDAKVIDELEHERDRLRARLAESEKAVRGLVAIVESRDARLALYEPPEGERDNTLVCSACGFPANGKNDPQTCHDPKARLIPRWLYLAQC